jgi:hypothetical protein
MVWGGAHIQAMYFWRRYFLGGTPSIIGKGPAPSLQKGWTLGRSKLSTKLREESIYQGSQIKGLLCSTIVGKLPFPVFMVDGKHLAPLSFPFSSREIMTMPIDFCAGDQQSD